MFRSQIFSARRHRHRHAGTPATRRNRFLHVERLEPRQLLAAIPHTTLSIPSEALLGETVSLDIGFVNNSPSDAGYGPFIDLQLPATGLDGAGALVDDGITFSSASYLGQSVPATVLTFNAAGQATHPLARDAGGNPVIVSGTPGDQLVVLQLPFGSYTPGQPVAHIQANVVISSLADANAPLSIQVGGGFRFGNDPLDNPTTDPSLLESPLHSASVMPIVYRLTKTYSGPEDETASGPNFPRQYTVTANLAQGVTLTSLQLTDVLPDNVQFVSVDSTLVHGAPVAADALATPDTSVPGGTLTRRFASVTGTSVANDASMTFTFYVPRMNAGGGDVLDPTTGDDRSSDNQARSVAQWLPTDSRDPLTSVAVDSPTPEHTLFDKSIAIQKSSSLVNDVGATGTTPGDTIAYQLTFQISDYFSFGDLIVTDVFSDGQRLAAGFTPTFSITDRQGAVAGSFAQAGGTPDLIVDLSEIGNDTNPATDGSTRLVFDVSQALRNAGAADGVLEGGRSVAPDAGPATGTITFHTTVQENFSDTYLPNTPNVSEGDSLHNGVTIDGSIRDNGNLTAVLGTEQDTSHRSITVVVGTLAKSVYAVNGNTSLTAPILVTPGDAVTYRFTYSMPMTDFDGLSLVDYLPLPIFDATTLTTFSATVSATSPAPGTMKHGPADTFLARTGLSPSLTTSATSNSFTVTYPDHDDLTSQPSVLDLLATFVVSADPFADRLLLTNQVRANQSTTNANDLVIDTLVQVVLTEPVLDIVKGVVATSNAHGTFSPSDIGPVVFSAPGSANPRFAAAINSTNLATRPINSNLSGIDAADLATFAVVIENTGTGLHGAFDIRVRDTLPAGFAIPTGGLNLSVTDGAGNALSYIDLGGGLFGTGLELVDAGSTGALAASHPANGRNIAVFTYDLVAQASVTAGSTLQNTTTLFHFAGLEGGTDHTATDLTDTADTIIASPAAAKNTPDTQAVIGEIVQFNIVVTVPEGSTPALRAVDTLDAGLAFVDLIDVSTSDATDVSWLNPVTPVVTNSGQTITFNLGTVTNADQDNNVAETLRISYRAVVLNVLGNQQGTNLNNSAIVNWAGGALPPVSSSQIGVVEPIVTTTKSVTVGGGGSTGDAGDAVQYIVTLRNNSGVDAFDVTVSDSLPLRAGTGSLIVSPSFSVVDTAGLVTSADFELVGDNNTGWALQTRPGVTFDMPNNAGRSITVTMTGTLSILVRPDETIFNTAQARFTSIDGSPGTISLYNTNSTERTGANGPGSGLNNYAVNGLAQIDIYDPTPTKSLPTSSESSTAGNAMAIGEIARYRVVSRLSEGTAPAFQLVDQLPAGLLMLNDGTARVAFVANGGGISSTTLSGAGLAVTGNESTLGTITPTFVLPGGSITGGPFASGTDPTFNLGTLVNPDSDADQEYVVLEFNALVENISTNNAGVTLNNTANVLVNAAAVGSNSNTVGVSIVEPSITNVVKTANPTSGDAGDTISYRVTFSNPAVANATTAFDLQLVDVLPAGMQLNLGSIAVSITNGTGVTNNSSGNTVNILIGSLAANGTVQIDFDVQLLGTVQPEQLLTNTANLVYTSLPIGGTSTNGTGSTNPGPAGSSTGERNGSGGHNDYRDSDDAAVTVTAPAVSKIVLSTNQSFTTGSDIAIGELVQYQLIFSVVEGTTNNMSVLDQFPSGLALVSLDSIVASPTLSTSAAGGFAGALAATNVQPGGHEFSILLQTVTNTDTNNSTAETIRVSFTAIVLNVGGNQNGVDLVNSATVLYSSGDVSATAPAVRVVEPVLGLDKSASSAQGDAGGSAITFTVVVTHDPASTTDAFDAVVQDVIPAGFNYVPASLAYVSGVVPGSLSEAGGTIGATYALFPQGSTSTLAFAATLNAFTTPGQTVTNTATLRYSSLPGNATTPLSPYHNLSTERTGNTADPGGPTNDYLDTGSIPVTVRSNSVSGSVFTDLTNNAVRDPGDPGIPNATLNLTGTDNLGNPVTATTTTDATGAFAFTNLRPGSYRIVETQPTGYLDGSDTLGTQGGSAVNDRFDFVLPVGVTTNGSGNNFGELLPARVSGLVYADLNNNGTQQPGEPGLGGVSMRLTGADDRGGNVDISVTTDGTGAFTFADLRPGTYALTESQPAGLLDGRDTVGSQGGTPGNDVISDFTLGPGDNETGNLFGELPPASIAGYVYEDLNQNASLDSSENGIGNVTITLTGTDDLGNTVTLATSTASDGSYLFQNLRPGTYALAETQPQSPFYFDGLDTGGSAGGVAANDQITGITIAAGTAGVSYLFGELPPADPVGYVYIDANNNGVRDPGEPPIQGVLITVTGTDDLGQPVLLTDTTDSNGFYQFQYLRRGTYRITETQPAGYIDGLEQNGTPPAIVGNDTFDGLALTWGQFAGDYNFGELAFGSLAGRVYVDVNQNGRSDLFEMGIPGVNITLTGLDIGGNPVLRTTTTGPTGDYTFANLVPGTYRIAETQPASYVDGPDQVGSLGGALLPDAVDQIFLAVNAAGIDYDFGENGLLPGLITKQYFLARNRRG